MTREIKARLEPAASIIRKLGGTAAVAEATGLSTVQIYRWTQSVDERGTGGRIPARNREALLAFAALMRIPLTSAEMDPPMKDLASARAVIEAHGGLHKLADALRVEPYIIVWWIATGGGELPAVTGLAEKNERMRRSQWKAMSTWARSNGLESQEIASAA